MTTVLVLPGLWHEANSLFPHDGGSVRVIINVPSRLRNDLGGYYYTLYRYRPGMVGGPISPTPVWSAVAIVADWLAEREREREGG